ncbi:ethanolamine utilization [Fusarium tjaetaba]|nr:ethanolamine utilization [Fusarium tjaetaba]KAF5643490.1 ethanolamine utilization [Fusarium tjaetaba]
MSKLVPLTVIKGAGHEFIPLPQGENATVADFHTIRTKTDAPAHITSGFYKIEAGPARPAHYDFEESKYVLSGQIDVLDEATGITHHLVPGDFAFFHVGSKVKFSTQSQGFAFYAVTRPVRAPHPNLKGREEDTKSRLLIHNTTSNARRIKLRSVTQSPDIALAIPTEYKPTKNLRRDNQPTIKMATCIGYLYLLPKIEIFNLDDLDAALEKIYGEGKVVWKTVDKSLIFESQTVDLADLREKLGDLGLTFTWRFPCTFIDKLRTALEPTGWAGEYINLSLYSYEFLYSPIHSNFYTSIGTMSAPEEPGIVQVVGEPKHFKLETLSRDLEKIHGKGKAGWKLIQAHKVKLVAITIEPEDIAAFAEHYENLGVKLNGSKRRNEKSSIH